MLSSLKLTTRTELGKQQLKKIRQIWQSIHDNNDSIHFRMPVDWQGLGLIDYLQIVKTPMDLNTISQKLNNEQYQTVEQVLDDFQLIWDDCKLYNQVGSWIFDIADKLQKLFKKLTRQHLPVVNLPAPPNSKQSAAEKAQQELVNHQEKVKFAEKLKNLKPEELGLLVAKITEVCPKAFKQVQGEKAQILMDLIDQNSFKIIQATLESLQEPDETLAKRVKY